MAEMRTAGKLVEALARAIEGGGHEFILTFGDRCRGSRCDRDHKYTFWLCARRS